LVDTFLISIRESPIFLAAQLMGIVGMIVSFVSFQNNTKKRILILQSAASFIWGIHYLMLGAFTGAGINFIEVVRNLVFAREKKLKKPWVWVSIFIVIFAVTGYLTSIGILSIATTGVVILVTISYCYSNPRFIRICATASSIIWLIYNGFQLSLAGVITESVVLVSLLIAFWRFDIKKQGGTTHDKK
jgi:hypothetical protein